jgi:hypothetical protein
MKTDLPVNVMPCALVYIDEDGVGSPNNRRPGSFRYVEQAITLNRNLLALGLPRLTIATNVPEHIGRYLADIADVARPRLLPIRPSIALPKSTRFYSAHFKLDLLEQAGRNLAEGTLLMLLDTDMFARWPLDVDRLQRCAGTGVGAFDISDQEFSAYGTARVICDLETVAGRRLANPRWFGGELLLASAGFIEELVPRARVFSPVCRGHTAAEPPRRRGVHVCGAEPPVRAGTSGCRCRRAPARRPPLVGRHPP